MAFLVRCSCSNSALGSAAALWLRLALRGMSGIAVKLGVMKFSHPQSLSNSIMLLPGLRPQHWLNGRKGVRLVSIGGALVTSAHDVTLMPFTCTHCNK